jgi:hypothetical protein
MRPGAATPPISDIIICDLCNTPIKKNRICQVTFIAYIPLQLLHFFLTLPAFTAVNAGDKRRHGLIR